MMYNIEFKSHSGDKWEHVEQEDFHTFKQASYYVGKLQEKRLASIGEINGEFRAVPVNYKRVKPLV